jgi:hypothetical protein
VVIPLDDSYPMDDIGIWRRRATDAPRQSDALKTERLCSRSSPPDDAPYWRRSRPSRHSTRHCTGARLGSEQSRGAQEHERFKRRGRHIRAGRPASRRGAGLVAG